MIKQLAVLGGEPYYKNEIHVGKPNLGDRSKFLASVNEILDSGRLTNDGPFVRNLENRIASYLGVKHCIAVANATIGLQIALMALDVKGEVLMPSYTFVATAHAAQVLGIKPVFVDIDRETHNIDWSKVERQITTRTSAILAVHLWGRPCSVDNIETVARKHDLRIVYDAAHSLGASYNGVMVGNFGDCEVFSLHATKFINSFEGGLVTTNSDELAEQLRLVRNFGFHGYDNVVALGTNGKMSEISAAMGINVFDMIDEIIDHNRENYRKYSLEFQGVAGVKIIQYPMEENCNYQYVVIEIDDVSSPLSRDEIVQVLHGENVLARKYFWPGCHRMLPYAKYYNQENDLENTNIVANRVIVLPTGRSVDAQDIEAICAIIIAAMENADDVRAALTRT